MHRFYRIIMRFLSWMLAVGLYEAVLDDDILLGEGLYVHYVDSEENRNIYYNHQGIFREVKLIAVSQNEIYLTVHCFVGSRSRFYKEMSSGHWFKIDKSLFAKEPSNIQEESAAIDEITYNQYLQYTNACRVMHTFR